MEVRECHHCKSLDAITLHNVPHRGSFALLCTACVLRHHTGSFCPLCFDIYDDTNNHLSNQSRVMCLRCPAMAHLTCLPSARSSSSFRFICPQCSDPSFKFFDFGVESSPSSKASNTNFLTRDLPKQLLCAATISSACMRRAASVARTNAELKVREAVAARKRAKEAMERVNYLMVNQDTEDGSDVDEESSG